MQYVVHLEHSEVIQDQFARLLGVQEGSLDEYHYMATDTPADARRQIVADRVKALVFDLGLKPKWDNKHLYPLLRHLALGEDLPAGLRAADCAAHTVALLAHRHHVPSAVLTHFASFQTGDVSINDEKLREVFHAQAIFRKDGPGLARCADWVRKTLGISATE